jgi:hypothetical protein
MLASLKYLHVWHMHAYLDGVGGGTLPPQDGIHPMGVQLVSFRRQCLKHDSLRAELVKGFVLGSGLKIQ